MSRVIAGDVPQHHAMDAACVDVARIFSAPPAYATWTDCRIYALARKRGLCVVFRHDVS